MHSTEVCKHMESKSFLIQGCSLGLERLGLETYSVLERLGLVSVSSRS